MKVNAWNVIVFGGGFFGVFCCLGLILWCFSGCRDIAPFPRWFGSAGGSAICLLSWHQPAGHMVE